MGVLLLLLLQMLSLPPRPVRIGGRRRRTRKKKWRRSRHLLPAPRLWPILPLLLLRPPPLLQRTLVLQRVPPLSTLLMLPLLLEASTPRSQGPLGLLQACAARAHACSFSLVLSLLLLVEVLLLLPLHPASLLIVPKRAVLTPLRETARVPTPRRMLLVAVQDPAEGVAPDGGADPPLPPRQSPRLVLSRALHLSPSLILRLIRPGPTHSTPIIYERISRSRCSYVSSAPSKCGSRIVYDAYANMIIVYNWSTHHPLAPNTGTVLLQLLVEELQPRVLATGGLVQVRQILRQRSKLREEKGVLRRGGRHRCCYCCCCCCCCCRSHC